MIRYFPNWLQLSKSLPFLLQLPHDPFLLTVLGNVPIALCDNILMAIELSAELGYGNILSVELAVSVHGVFVCLSSVSCLLFLLFGLVDLILEVVPVLLEPVLLPVSPSLVLHELVLVSVVSYHFLYCSRKLKKCQAHFHEFPMPLLIVAITGRSSLGSLASHTGLGSWS